MILVVSYEGEDHTADVLSRLSAAGKEVAVVDLGAYPEHRTLSMSYGPGEDPRFSMDSESGRLDLRDCRVGWWRRLRPFSVHAALGSQHRAFAASETTEALHGLLESLPCRWVNPPRHDQAAHHKPYQWAVAGRLGLTVPRTLVTSRPEEAEAFVTGLGWGHVVFKAFLASLDAWRETRLVRPEDLEHIKAVRYAPVTFQEYVPGVDYRVTVVGDQTFTTEIDASATAYPVDMRMVVGEARVRPAVLPGALDAALRLLVRQLGLVYGAIDLRRRPDGEFVFLEVNPAGQWLFCEQRTGLPISSAVASMLARWDEQRMEDGAAARAR